MAFEIERKFLVKNSAWKELCDKGTPIKQGYLNSHKERTVRVRIKGDKGFLTIKGIARNITRHEFEYEIPCSDAVSMLKICEMSIIDKTRYEVKQGDITWEIDVFYGDNEGLIIAEVELKSENQQFEKPKWLGQEVSGNVSYYNANLISNPYKNWK